MTCWFNYKIFFINNFTCFKKNKLTANKTFKVISGNTRICAACGAFTEDNVITLVICIRNMAFCSFFHTVFISASGIIADVENFTVLGTISIGSSLIINNYMMIFSKALLTSCAILIITENRVKNGYKIFMSTND